MERDILHVSASSPEKTALRFWEIDSMFRCPVIGVCLTESEQIAILKKAGVPSKDKNSSEIHELLVASAGSENRLSFRIDHFLWQKFGEQASHIHSFDENDMLEQSRNTRGHWTNRKRLTQNCSWKLRTPSACCWKSRPAARIVLRSTCAKNAFSSSAALPGWNRNTGVSSRKEAACSNIMKAI